MDLVQIRKKAKKENAKRTAMSVDPSPRERVEEALPEEAAASHRGAGSSSGKYEETAAGVDQRVTTQQHAVVQQTVEKSPVSRSRLQSPGQSIDEILDPLEALFRQSDAGGQFATEENYFDGLVDASERVAEESGRQLLSFALGDEEYAVDITQVRETIKPREITEIPRVPDFMLGIISLRGVIIPVIDLNRRLKLGNATLSATSRIVVCQTGSRYSGLLVDKIHQVLRMSSNTIEAAPAMLSSLDRDYVSGIGRIQGRMVILLDLDAVMNIEG